MMLQFYGMQLADKQTGKLQRHPKVWEERYLNLIENTHNNLRITRILQSLSHLGKHVYVVVGLGACCMHGLLCCLFCVVLCFVVCVRACVHELHAWCVMRV